MSSDHLVMIKIKLGGGFNTFGFLAMLIAGFNVMNIVSNNINNRNNNNNNNKNENNDNNNQVTFSQNFFSSSTERNSTREGSNLTRKC